MNPQLQKWQFTPGIMTQQAMAATDTVANGDLYIGTGNNSFTRLPVGTMNQILQVSDTNGDLEWASLSSLAAGNLLSATTTINISSATAPSNGQVLTATSSTAATWQTPANSVQFATSGSQSNFATTSGSFVDVTGATVTINPTKTVTVMAIVSGSTVENTLGSGQSIQLLIDGNVIQTYSIDDTAAMEGKSFCLSGQASVSSGSRVIKMQTQSDGVHTVNVNAANVNIIYG